MTETIFDCAACDRTIGKRASHHILDDHRIACSRCFTQRRAAHHDAFPDCTIPWHRLSDHSSHVTATRAGARIITEFWSRPQSTPPTLHARRSDNGRTLIVDCPGCGRRHTHGRHIPPTPTGCTAEMFNSKPCTCPTGTGDGHRVAHCHNGAMQHGYFIEETA